MISHCLLTDTTFQLGIEPGQLELSTNRIITIYEIFEVGFLKNNFLGFVGILTWLKGEG